MSVIQRTAYTSCIDSLNAAVQQGQLSEVKHFTRLLVTSPIMSKPDSNLSDSLKLVYSQKLSFKSCQEYCATSPLQTASIYGKLDIVEFFVHDIGCDPYETNSENMNCLSLAVKEGHLDVLKMLLGKNSGLVPDNMLHIASQHGHLNVISYLIQQHKCNPSCLDASGATPLHVACQEGHIDIVAYLITKHACDPNATQDNGKNCLHIACSYGRTDIINYLYNTQNCRLNRDLFGHTALHCAAFNGQLSALKFLVECLKCDSNDCENYTGSLPLHFASMNGHCQAVKYLVSTCHSDINSLNKEGKSSIYLAVAGGHFEAVKYLTKNSSDQENCDKAFQLAVKAGHFEMVKYFIESERCNPNQNNQFGGIPLHDASENGHLNIVKYLVSVHQCNILYPDEDGLTPLHFAASKGHLELVKYYAEACTCNPEQKTVDDETPLHYASYSGHLDVVKYLIECLNCNPRHCRNSLGRIPLHDASENGHLQVVKYLVELQHCDPFFHDKQGLSPVHLAASTGQIEVVKYFTCKKHSHQQQKYAKLNTPLHLAAKNGHLTVVKFFIDNLGYEPNVKGNFEKFLLHDACENGHKDIVRYLVEEKYCDPSCHDRQKQTPLHFAAANGQLEVVRYLVTSRHCNPLCRNARQDTPLHLAAHKGHVHVVKFLIEDVKCNYNICNSIGLKPLHYAITYGHFEVYRYLMHLTNSDLSLGGNFKSKNADKYSLLWAIQGQNLDVIEHLINTRRLDPYIQPNRKKLLKAAKINDSIASFCKNYVDPLHNAAVHGDIETVRYYIEKRKWCPMKLDRHGNNTLHNAANYGQLEIVKYLTGGIQNKLTSDPVCNPSSKNISGLTAYDLAAQSGHHHVESYLIRATTTQPISRRYILSPSLNIFVLGNSGSGKSTLIKALSKENDRLGRFSRVKGVIPMTAGIVPSTLYSHALGRVKIYDFAGHEEYYASHGVILTHTTQALVLLVIDISLPPNEVEKQFLYWLSILSTHFGPESSTTHQLLVIGSHSDMAKANEKQSNQQRIELLVSQELPMQYQGFCTCDCRYSGSTSMEKIRQRLHSISKSSRLLMTLNESDYSNRLCASLMYFINHNLSSEVATIAVSKLCAEIEGLKSPSPTLLQLSDPQCLTKTCNSLSCNGHLIFLSHDKCMDSMLVLNEKTILSQVHASLSTIKKMMTNEFGILDENQLKKALSKTLDGSMEPEFAIQYLLLAQFCTRISNDQLQYIQNNDTIKHATHYFFPNLALASRPAEMWFAERNTSTQIYTWCIKSSQFFVPELLHTLFIQLTNDDCCNSNNDKYTIWKNGILVSKSNGTKSMIEVTDQGTSLYYAIQSMKECETQLVKQRSTLISFIKSLLKKHCPALTLEEFLLEPHHVYPPEDNIMKVPIADVKHSIIHSQPAVVCRSNEGEVPQLILLTNLLIFDAFHVLDTETLQKLVGNRDSEQAVPKNVLRKIHDNFEGSCTVLKKVLKKIFEGQVTFQELYKTISQYSIFYSDNTLSVSMPVIATRVLFNFAADNVS